MLTYERLYQQQIDLIGRLRQEVEGLFRIADIRPSERGDAVLFHTGWGELWMRDNATYLSGEPGPGMELATWLVEQRIALTGCDTWSFGPVPPEDPSRPFVVPQTLNVRHGLFIVENLFTSELARDGVTEFMFALTHAKVKGATGAWVSPVAIH